MADIANLVWETSISTGTGNMTLAAAAKRFSAAFGTGATTDVFPYFIVNRGAVEWEYGTGHMSDANTLVRDTVIESSNSNNAVAFSAGIKDVTNALPADQQARFVAQPIGYLLVTANGTFNKASYPGVKQILVRGVGGGAGGAGSGSTVNRVGGGGGAGGGFQKLINAADLAPSTVLTIGSAGIGGTSTGNGTAGGTTSFGVHCSATGGSPGQQGGSFPGGDGGSATGGDLNLAGQKGASGGDADAAYAIGLGGTPPLGFGTGGLVTTLLGGNPGTGYGAGGGGGHNHTAGGAQPGGNGAPGAIEIYMFF